MSGSFEECFSVGFGEVLVENRDAAQVKSPIGEHLEENGMFSGSARHLDSKVGFVLG